MKKLDARIKSDIKCIQCGELLKQNLINKKPDANLCYYCYSVKTHNPSGHMNRIGYKASGEKDTPIYVKSTGRYRAEKNTKSK